MGNTKILVAIQLIILNWLVNCFQSSYCQVIFGDSMKIEFNKGITLPKEVKNENELSFNICITNTSNKTIDAYSELEYGKSPSIFNNYDCQLFKKEGNEYKRVDYYSSDAHTYGGFFERYYPMFDTKEKSIYEIKEKVDSVICLYDMPKMKLLPGKTDTLTFNLLHDVVVLVPGEYKCRILLRVKTNQNGIKQPLDIKDIVYANSEWYYFRVEKLLISSLAEKAP